MNYAEADSGDEDDELLSATAKRGRRTSKRQKIIVSDDEDDYVAPAADSPDADFGDEGDYGISGELRP